MNKAIRIQKSEAARNKRHIRRDIANQKLLNQYEKLKKLKKSK